MPKTIESIIDNHNAATERRKAGKPIWDRRIHIKYLITGDTSDAAANKVGKEIAAVLRASTWFAAVRKENPYDDLVCVTEEFEDIDGLDHFNAVLDRLHDLADADRVWIS